MYRARSATLLGMILEDVRSLGVPELAAAAEQVERIHAERARLFDEQLAAEREFVHQAAAAHHAGHLDWWGLLDAYDQVREWGITGFSKRWQEQIPHDRMTLRRFAEATPRSTDGTWSGDTGWEGLDDSLIPARGTHVVYVLFGNGGVPVHIGMTLQFRAHVKRHHRAGVSWVSWKAWPCTGREDALEVRKRITAQYSEPNAALVGTPATAHSGRCSRD